MDDRTVMRPNANQEFGSRGEQLALHYLRDQGYTILTMNWICRYGEIDIVAQQGNVIVFVEVRTRHAINTESAFESINPGKQRRMAAAAQAYLTAHQLEDSLWRVDIIAVAIPRMGEPVIEHVEDGLAWD